MKDLVLREINQEKTPAEHAVALTNALGLTRKAFAACIGLRYEQAKSLYDPKIEPSPVADRAVRRFLKGACAEKCAARVAHFENEINSYKHGRLDHFLDFVGWGFVRLRKETGLSEFITRKYTNRPQSLQEHTRDRIESFLRGDAVGLVERAAKFKKRQIKTLKEYIK